MITQQHKGLNMSAIGHIGFMVYVKAEFPITFQDFKRKMFLIATHFHGNDHHFPRWNTIFSLASVERFQIPQPVSMLQ